MPTNTQPQTTTKPNLSAKPKPTPNFTKTIFHIDYDSFFASVEQQYHPELRNKPIGVTGSSLSKGVICAASGEAKKLGVKTAMPVFKAKQICPQIITVKGDFTKYQYIHKETLKILSKYSDLVEPFSIDESFMDMTSTIKFFGTPEQTIHKLKQEIKEKFGDYITCSIGVGPNKLMAKLTSDINKPNGHFIVTPENIETTLLNSKLKDFCGIGNQIEKRLNKLNVFNVADLRDIGLEILIKEFGNVEGHFLYNLSWGLDNSLVEHINHKELPKSLGHQHTLSKNTSNNKVILNNLHRLSEMVSKRLRYNKMIGKTIGVYLRDKDFQGTFERKTINPPTDSSKVIAKTVEEIFWKMNWKKETRLVGVTICNLTTKTQTTLPLFQEEVINEKLDTAMDLINNKFGDFTLIPANTLLADETKGKISSFLRH